MKCVETYDGKEFWIDEERAKQLDTILELANPPKRVDINGTKIVVNNIAGIFDELDMKEKEYRKQGMYICEFMRWHYFKEICHCGLNFANYGIFEFPSADIKSKRLLEYEAKHGLLELNIVDGHPKEFSVSTPLDILTT